MKRKSIYLILAIVLQVAVAFCSSYGTSPEFMKFAGSIILLGLSAMCWLEYFKLAQREERSNT